MTFFATEAVALGQNRGRIEGKLTRLGVTRPMTLQATINKSARYPLGDEQHAIGIDARGSLRRSGFGMTYGVENDFVGDEIEIAPGFEAVGQG